MAVFDQIFALYFTFEMVVKMLALGVRSLCNSPASIIAVHILIYERRIELLAFKVFRFGTDREVYFDSKWNQFDFVIVVTGLIDFVPGVEVWSHLT